MVVQSPYDIIVIVTVIVIVIVTVIVIVIVTVIVIVIVIVIVTVIVIVIVTVIVTVIVIVSNSISRCAIGIHLTTVCRHHLPLTHPHQVETPVCSMHCLVCNHRVIFMQGITLVQRHMGQSPIM